MRMRTPIILAAATLGALVLLAAPGSRADAPPCPAGMERFAEYRLFFGRSRDGVEVVSDSEWRSFLTEEITPRFPRRPHRAGRGRAVARPVRHDRA